MNKLQKALSKKSIFYVEYGKCVRVNNAGQIAEPTIKYCKIEELLTPILTKFISTEQLTFLAEQLKNIRHLPNYQVVIYGFGKEQALEVLVPEGAT